MAVSDVALTQWRTLLYFWIASETAKYKYHQQALSWSFRERQYVAPKNSTYQKLPQESCRRKRCADFNSFKLLNDLQYGCRFQFLRSYVSRFQPTRGYVPPRIQCATPTNQHQPRLYEKRTSHLTSLRLGLRNRKVGRVEIGFWCWIRGLLSLHTRFTITQKTSCPEGCAVLLSLEVANCASRSG